ncbi:MAG TPA: hypothetical protein DCE42_12395 [Myxococcales bacterium]|nr:hypothetical protein [Deltaproteobacteria bacterium]HAA55552.1 hypothetical protein [Myxococcales bacterium]
MNKKITSCTACTKTFWYIDPRPGGRPRQKCGICSSRPPRYPWGFLAPDQEPPPAEETYIPAIHLQSSSDAPEYTDSIIAQDVPPLGKKKGKNGQTYSITVLDNSLIPQSSRRELTTETRIDGSQVEYAVQMNNSNGSVQHQSMKKGNHKAQLSDSQFKSLEQTLHNITHRLERLEEQIEEIKDHAIARAEWVDLSARLDIVEQETNQTLGKVRSKLDTFSKDVKQIAVVPERELNEMFDIVHLLHGYLAPENSGNR